MLTRITVASSVTLLLSLSGCTRENDRPLTPASGTVDDSRTRSTETNEEPGPISNQPVTPGATAPSGVTNSEPTPAPSSQDSATPGAGTMDPP